MTLSEFSIRRPVFAWTLMFALIFFGLMSFQQMGINENPDVDFPTLRVTYEYEGATPSVVEKDVLEPAESVLISMSGIKTMTSVAQRGQASITLEFDLEQDIDVALQEVQSLVARAQRQLPDTINPPIVRKSNAADDAIMYMALAVPESMSTRELMVLFRDQIRDRFSTIKGVSEVRGFGYHEPVMRIDLNKELLKKYQLTALDIVQSIKREHKELPAGKLEEGSEEQFLRITGEVNDVESFKNMVISRRGGSPNYRKILLKDVADIYEGTENIRRISRNNGEPSLAMAIQKQRGENSVEVAKRVKENLKQINQELPEGVELRVNFDSTQFIEDSVNELLFTLILSALLTSLVCWLFLGSFSATINVLLAIPTAIIGTFIFINWMGFTLNTFSLLGLTLAIGVVVDDAIIMLENIVRYLQKGLKRIDAAYIGSKEITFAVIATSVALISIFIPIAFIKDIEGRFFLEFSVTLSIAVALSSIEALTLSPMRCSQFLSTSERVSLLGRYFEAGVDKIRNLYTDSLDKVLNNKKKSIAISLLLFVVSLYSVKIIDKEFSPPKDSGVIFTIFLAPNGKSMAYTDKRIKEFERIVSKHPAVARMFVSVGGFGGSGQGNRGNGVVILKDHSQRNLSQFEVASQLREQVKAIEGMQIIIRDRFGSAIGGRRGSPVEFTISGPDPKVQKELYFKLKERLESSGLIVGVRSDDALELPEVRIQPNRQKAQARGVEVSQIADTINATFGGVTPAQYTQNSRRFDIFVQLSENDRKDYQDIKDVLIRNNRGEVLPVADVVDIVESSSPQYIYREDRIRGIRVDGGLAKGVAEGEALDLVKKVEKEIMPEKYFLRFSSTPDDKLMNMLMIMLLGLLVAYMILAIQFNSFVDPFVVFVAIPFAITGSLIALLLGGQTLNVYSAIGILLTMGIVKKNSILIVEFSNQLRDQGKDLNLALREACATRFRPILMTTCATLAAALPPALAFGPGSETRVPMALTVIGGVSLSAFFTLFVVPCIYVILATKRKAVEINKEAIEKDI